MAEQKEFIDSVVSVNRVTKVTKGGKRFSFSAFVVSGDQNGRVGIGLGKSSEVSSAIAKATMRARKNMITVPLRDTTIPYNVTGKHGATRVILTLLIKVQELLQVVQFVRLWKHLELKMFLQNRLGHHVVVKMW